MQQSMLRSTHVTQELSRKAYGGVLLRHKHARLQYTVHAVASSAQHSLVEECDVSNWRSPLGSLNTEHTRITPEPDYTPEFQPQCRVVALGKFDAMHIGHRSLIEKAASMGDEAWLVSFSGMAAELGWPQRLPLVALRSRPAILRGWAPACGGVVPHLRRVPFAAVRHLSPREFVTALALDMKASGVVVGCNYRFGFKAAGTAETLKQIGGELGLDVAVMDLMGDDSNANGNVSSSEVRKMLAAGHVDRIAQWLGRPYCLVAEHAERLQEASQQKASLQIKQQHFENQQPGPGTYSAILLPAMPSTSVEFPIDDTGVAIATEIAADGSAKLELQHGHDWPTWATTGPLLLKFV